MIEFKKKYKDKLWYPNRVQWWLVVPKKISSSDINFECIECRIRDIVYKSRTPEYENAFASERMWEKLHN